MCGFLNRLELVAGKSGSVHRSPDSRQLDLTCSQVPDMLRPGTVHYSLDIHVVYNPPIFWSLIGRCVTNWSVIGRTSELAGSRGGWQKVRTTQYKLLTSYSLHYSPCSQLATPELRQQCHSWSNHFTRRFAGLSESLFSFAQGLYQISFTLCFLNAQIKIMDKYLIWFLILCCALMKCPLRFSNVQCTFASFKALVNI